LLAGLERPLAIVAHDAGAANLLAAWLAETDGSGVAACLSGPACGIFARSCSHLQQMHLEELLAWGRTLISGSGWASSLEHDARVLARRAGCRSIAVVDHWTDYRKRFSRGGVEVLPDELWVADEEARRLANDTFADLPVRQLPNTYLKNLVAAVQRAEMLSNDRSRHLLYVLEPIRDDWGPLPKPGEFLALDFFAQQLRRLDLAQDVQIRLRPHPSDPPSKYDEWIASHPLLRVKLDERQTLEEALAWAGTVVGCQTYAMVVALAAGRRVACSIPPGMPSCQLHHPGILHLADFSD
jgi:hypothetical protein